MSVDNHCHTLFDQGGTGSPPRRMRAIIQQARGRQDGVVRQAID